MKARELEEAYERMQGLQCHVDPSVTLAMLSPQKGVHTSKVFEGSGIRRDIGILC